MMGFVKRQYSGEVLHLGEWRLDPSVLVCCWSHSLDDLLDEPKSEFIRQNGMETLNVVRGTLRNLCLVCKTLLTTITHLIIVFHLRETIVCLVTAESNQKLGRAVV